MSNHEPTDWHKTLRSISFLEFGTIIKLITSFIAFLTLTTSGIAQPLKHEYYDYKLPDVYAYNNDVNPNAQYKTVVFNDEVFKNSTTNADNSGTNLQRAKFVDADVLNKPVVVNSTNPALRRAFISEYISSCSDTFKQDNKDFIEEYSIAPLITHYSGDDNLTTNFIKTSYKNEPLSCQLGTLQFAEQVSLIKVFNDQVWLQNGAGGHETFLTAHILKVQADLFDIYMRQSVLTTGNTSTHYFDKANAIWLMWSELPLEYNTKEAIESAHRTIMVKYHGINNLIEILSSFNDLLSQMPKKQALLQNQTVAFISELNDNYSTITNQLYTFSTSSNQQNEVLKMSSQTTDLESLFFYHAVFEDMKLESFKNFINLTKLRYINFEDHNALNASNFLAPKPINQLPMLQFAIAMDYAMLNDYPSSQRWLNKVKEHTDFMNQLCGFESYNLFNNENFMESNMLKWFETQVLIDCK